MCMDRSLYDLPRPHACFGRCWCEAEPTDAELERLTEEFMADLEAAAKTKRESRNRIGSTDATYRPGGFTS